MGITWFKLTNLMKALTCERFWIFLVPILLVTLLGWRSTPTIKACPNFLSLLGSSLARNKTAFLPLKRPAVTTTSLPGFKLSLNKKRRTICPFSSNQISIFLNISKKLMSNILMDVPKLVLTVLQDQKDQDTLELLTSHLKYVAQRLGDRKVTEPIVLPR